MLLSWVLTLTVALVLPLKALSTIERKWVKLGEPVVLKCNISLHHEIFWLRVSIMEKPRLLMVARLKNDGGLTEVLNYNSTHFEGCLVDKFFGLRIFSVLNNDLGSYYCGIVEGKHMEFEDGVHIYGDIRNESVSNCKEAFPPLPPVAGKGQLLYPMFAAALGVGLLVMVLVVFIVHMMAYRKMH
ncbi:hypothetical protein PGIGA_G00186730 [Pangasianodon gigas]|uniref:Uncharacterized protein n=1 Tax=Pangasianodon gigas TaxID=30993 RepID=A0ACC5WB41_PANGG|nr:hypothetical protein [Pangasianodon gigas]